MSALQKISMKLPLRSFVLALVMLGAPVAATAAVSTSVWRSPFRPLPVEGGGPAQPVLLEGSDGKINGDSGQARDVPLPFPFQHFDSSWETIHIGAKGYVTFGTNRSESNAAHPSPSALLQPGSPRNVIAAWWGDHFCDEGQVKTQVVGEAPHRRFVIEWNGCSRRLTTNAGTDTTFQAQLWLHEGSGVVRASLGRVKIDPVNRWRSVAWGIKAEQGVGLMGPGPDGIVTCTPAATGGYPSCDGEKHFPAGVTIQYGDSPSFDLTGAVDGEPTTLSAGELRLEARTTIRNVGVSAVDGASYRLYLSEGQGLEAGASGPYPIFERSSVSELEGRTERSFIDTAVAPRPPNGNYWLCASYDDSNELGEIDRSNNVVCSETRIPVGPDLVGTIAAPLTGEPNLVVSIPLSIRNIGNDVAGSFGFRVKIVSAPLQGANVPDEEIYVGTVSGLAAGGVFEETVQARLPRIARGERYTFVLTIDPEGAVPEAERANNEARSQTQMENRRPQLKITTPASGVHLPDGCFYGEPIEATFQVCNSGTAQARDFHPGVIMGDGTQINSSFDAPAASSPQLCGVPGTWNYASCAPIAGGAPTCAFEFCRLECRSDADCASAGLVCGDDVLLAEHLGVQTAKSCMNRLAPGGAPSSERCKTFTMRGRIPVEDQVGNPHTSGKQRFHLIDDVTHSMSQLLPDVVTGQVEFDCRPALLDLAALRIDAAPAVVAGKATPITRHIRNEGFINLEPGSFQRPERTTFRYRYYLSKTEDVSVHQIPLELASTGGAGSATIGRKGDDLRTDSVLIPASLDPGEYFLGLVLDPDGEHQELDKKNNTLVLPRRILVQPAGLEIITSSLPSATEGVPYVHPLVAVGGAGAYSFSGNGLPPGMSLSEGGLLEGTPSEAGSYPFVARVSSGGAHMERMLSLLIVEGQSSLDVTTSELPLAVKGEPYARWYDASAGAYREGARLAASGGTPPYRWELDPAWPDNLLPAGLRGPTEDGWITGQATPMSKTAEVVVRVTDAMGKRAKRKLVVRVVDAGTLVIPSRPFPLATTAKLYEGCVEAGGGGVELRWDVERASLPTGLVPEPRGRSLCLVGTPTVCGDHMVRVRVQDEEGQRAGAAVPLSVECGRLQLLTRDLHPLARGETATLRLGATPEDEPRFRLIRGALPTGLVFQEDGRIEGTVAEDAWVGVYDLIVEVQDARGRRGLGAASLVVRGERPAVEHPMKKEKTGCSGAGGGGGGLLIPALVTLFGVARRRLTPGPRLRGAQRRGRIGGLALAATIAGVGAAAVGCGEEETQQPASVCASVQCEEGLLCDEADGLCKCGGVRCAEGEVCQQEPSPSCVAKGCEFVFCKGGESCDALTGLCGCGVERCEEGQVCVNERCVEGDLCDGASCSDGTSCDPTDGVCKCGEAACDVGQSCIEDVCEDDPCAGVHCGANSICNPIDGICHCGGAEGAICATGEACVRSGEGYECDRSESCGDVVCPGGSTCDPVDGLCRCGGAGPEHPVCGEDQTCLDGECVGGLLCEPGGMPTTCSPELSCDPTDGVCKCGGKNGDVCEEGEACTVVGGSHRCAATCTLLDPDACPRGEGCYFDAAQIHGEAFCAEAGAVPLDGKCEGPTECAPGLHCTLANRCARLCDTRAGLGFCSSIGPNLQCVPFQGGGIFGYCRAP